MGVPNWQLSPWGVLALGFRVYWKYGRLRRADVLLDGAGFRVSGSGFRHPQHLGLALLCVKYPAPFSPGVLGNFFWFSAGKTGSEKSVEATVGFKPSASHREKEAAVGIA